MSEDNGMTENFSDAGVLQENKSSKGGEENSSPLETGTAEESGSSESDSDAKAEDADASGEKPQPKNIWSTVFLWALALAACAMLATILYMQNRDNPGSVPLLTGAAEVVGEDGSTPVQEQGGYFVIVCLYAMAGAAAFSDASLRLIPNRFTYTALILALVLNMLIVPFLELVEWNDVLFWIGANSGPWGGVALESLKGFALCFVVGIISFAARGLGGGDVKLLMALGVLAGFSLTVSILLNTLVVAAIIGLVNLFFQGRLIQYLQKFFLVLYVSLMTKKYADPKVFGRTESPFCLSLLIGMILLPFVNMHTVISEYLRNFSAS